MGRFLWGRPFLIKPLEPAKETDPVPDYSYPKFDTNFGYMTQTTQRAYIAYAQARGLLPADALERRDITSLKAPNDPKQPIQFWQLFSAIGPDPIVTIVQDFYERVFADEDWFVSVFARVGPVDHHVYTQASMWVDTMGAGAAYHGADYRLSFHHTHNAMALMNERGAERWVRLMVQALDAKGDILGDDPRLRIALNTFLSYFLGKYADEFEFGNVGSFGPTNGAYVARYPKKSK